MGDNIFTVNQLGTEMSNTKITDVKVSECTDWVDTESLIDDARKTVHNIIHGEVTLESVKAALQVALSKGYYCKASEIALAIGSYNAMQGSWDSLEKGQG